MKKYSIKELYEYDYSIIEVKENEDGKIQHPLGRLYLDKYHCILDYISDKVKHSLPFFVPFTEYSSIIDIYDAYGKALEVYYRLCYDEHPYATIQMHLFSNALDITFGDKKRFKAIDRYMRIEFEFNDFKEFVKHEYYQFEKCAIDNIFNSYTHYTEELILYINKLKDNKYNLQELYKILSMKHELLYQLDISQLFLVLNFEALDILDDPDYQSRISERLKELGGYCSEQYFFPDEVFR